MGLNLCCLDTFGDFISGQDLGVSITRFGEQMLSRKKRRNCSSNSQMIRCSFLSLLKTFLLFLMRSASTSIKKTAYARQGK